MRLFAILVLSLTLGGCVAENAAAIKEGFIGTRWQLRAIDGHTVVIPASLEIDKDGNVGVHGGCNTMSGSAALRGHDIAIEVSKATTMACIGGGRMELDGRYSNALARAVRWRITQRRLFLFGRDGKEVLAFQAIG